MWCIFFAFRDVLLSCIFEAGKGIWSMPARWSKGMAKSPFHSFFSINRREVFQWEIGAGFLRSIRPVF